MNKETLPGKWKELKGEIRNQWGKLTDDEIESTKGNLTAISGLIQQRYGDAKEGSSEKLKSLFSRFGARVEDMGDSRQESGAFGEGRDHEERSAFGNEERDQNDKGDDSRGWMAKKSQEVKESFRNEKKP